MHPHLAEVVTEARLHEGAGGSIQRLARAEAMKKVVGDGGV